MDAVVDAAVNLSVDEKVAGKENIGRVKGKLKNRSHCVILLGIHNNVYKA